MPNPNQCSMCEEAATVHLSQFTQGKIITIHLCEACAQKGGDTDPAIFQLAETFAKGLPPPSLVCPTCGFTDLDLHKLGRLGCPECWKVFGDSLGAALSKLQHDTKHVGRIPDNFMSVDLLRERVRAARAEMIKTMDTEDFETAAKLRDLIRSLNKKIASL